MLPQVIAVGAYSVDILSECSGLQGLGIVEILESGDLPLGVIELLLSASDFKRPGLDNFLSLSISYYCSLEVVFKSLESVNLVE